MMAEGAIPAMETTRVFERGDIQWKQLKVDASTASSSASSSSSSSSSPPKPLLIFTPTVPGAYPVILFCHGFFIPNTFYSHLLTHIVSHGFILVAPQLFCKGFPMLEPSEVKFAGKVADWLAEGLQPLLPENVEANLEKLVVSGHSKGGKTAFCVALGYAKTKLKFSALVGIDPVAGTSKSCETNPRILKGVPGSFNLNMPVAVIGSELGPKKGNCCSPPCAPDGMNHKEFFKECKPPCANFVVASYGHMDMLDDDTAGVIGTLLSKCACKNGSGPRDLMRRTIGGLVVAFLRAQLNDHWKDFDAILGNPNLAPTQLDNMVYLPAS